MSSGGPMRGVVFSLLLCVACASTSDPMSYRLEGTGSHWSDGPGAAVVEEVRERYPAFFEVILDPSDTRDPDLRPLRRDLEFTPVERRNFDALNAVAIAYFELNYRAEADRGGALYLGNSFRAAHLLAIPWRAYSEVGDPRLRDAILDFFEDAGSGEKLGSGSTAPRLARIVASLEDKEQDAERRDRIQRLARDLERGAGLPEQGADR
jgi:hypothetical protein